MVGGAVGRLVAEAAGFIAGFKAELIGDVLKRALDILDAFLKDALLSRKVEELVDAVRKLHCCHRRAGHIDLDAEIEAGKLGDGTGRLGDDVGGKNVLVVDRKR
ncbi:hypothetical protein V491_02924 [Pseudogymnoascus sp. VKM F-3775]|nr:hypothetical protein V491_02924 [Pseudogymnoascus sp. VKM F-3775]